MNTSTARKPKRKYHIQSEAQIQTKSEVFSDWDGSDKTPVSAPVWKSTQSFAFLPFRIYIFQYILYILPREENLLGLQEMVFVLVKNKPQGGFSRTENVRIYHSHS